jgi:hypothetical protein
VRLLEAPQGAAMPLNLPIAASGSRAPDKQRPRPLPKHVREMVRLMVYGLPGDDDARPLDFIEAGKLAGIKPDIARKWLDRPETRMFLRAERRAYREAICAGNEGALKRLRDGAPNSMVQLNAVRTLEDLSSTEEARPAGRQPIPGLVIQIIGGPSRQTGGPEIDVTPSRDEPELEPAPRSPDHPRPPLARPRR